MSIENGAHAKFTNDAGEEVVGIVKEHKDGQYELETVNEKTHEKEMHKVPEDKVRRKDVEKEDPNKCPVVRGEVK